MVTPTLTRKPRHHRRQVQTCNKEETSDNKNGILYPNYMKMQVSAGISLGI